MCGIAGIIDLSGSKRASQQNLSILSTTLHHRGPDDEGFLVSIDGKITTCFGAKTPAIVKENNYPYCPTISLEQEKRTALVYCIGGFPLLTQHLRVTSPCVVKINPFGLPTMAKFTTTSN